MFTTLETARLLLVPTPLVVMKTRLERSDFVATIPVTTAHGTERATSELQVHFPDEWPGDALGLFVRWVAQHETGARQEMWGGTMIHLTALVAIGQMSLMVVPDDPTTVELGYGVNPSFQNQGYATEMAGALVDWALTQLPIERVTAACLAHNAASRRVLTKVGFHQTGTQMDAEGQLILWERTVS